MGNSASNNNNNNGKEENANDVVVKFKAVDMPENRNKAKPISKGTALEIKYDEKNYDNDDVTIEKIKSSPQVSHFYDCDNPPPLNAKILLHSCCAPCSGAMFEQMLKEKYDVTIFFYNPNIHPKKEYEIRKEENKRYARKYNRPFIDCDYDARSWFERMRGLENDPERLGTRCVACFDMRMEVTAHYALKHGFDGFTTTNATSRWKDESQVDGAGLKVAKDLLMLSIKGNINNKKVPKFWIRQWKTDTFTKRKYEISAEEKFYKQEYCGCSYSLRDSNTWRKQNGIPLVRIGGEIAGLGTRYFENPDIDAEEESQEVVDSFFKAAKNHFKVEEGVKEIEQKDKDDDVKEILNEVYGNRKKNVNEKNNVKRASLNNW